MLGRWRTSRSAKHAEEGRRDSQESDLATAAAAATTATDAAAVTSMPPPKPESPESSAIDVEEKNEPPSHENNQNIVTSPKTDSPYSFKSQSSQVSNVSISHGTPVSSANEFESVHESPASERSDVSGSHKMDSTTTEPTMQLETPTSVSFINEYGTTPGLQTPEKERNVESHVVTTTPIEKTVYMQQETPISVSSTEKFESIQGFPTPEKSQASSYGSETPTLSDSVQAEHGSPSENYPLSCPETPILTIVSETQQNPVFREGFSDSKRFVENSARNATTSFILEKENQIESTQVSEDFAHETSKILSGEFSSNFSAPDLLEDNLLLRTLKLTRVQKNLNENLGTENSEEIDKDSDCEILQRFNNQNYIYKTLNSQVSPTVKTSVVPEVVMDDPIYKGNFPDLELASTGNTTNELTPNLKYEQRQRHAWLRGGAETSASRMRETDATFFKENTRKAQIQENFGSSIVDVSERMHSETHNKQRSSENGVSRLNDNGVLQCISRTYAKAKFNNVTGCLIHTLEFAVELLRAPIYFFASPFLQVYGSLQSAVGACCAPTIEDFSIPVVYEGGETDFDGLRLQLEKDE